MINRRAFIKKAAIAAGAVSPIWGSSSKTAAAANYSTISPTSIVRTVPDTLDLAHHGALAINGVLGSLNPAIDYECTFWTILDVHPPYMLHWSTMVSGVMPKYVEALPMLRQMSGSRGHMDLEKG